ncbi:MAG: hypothetical protein ACR2HG_01395 [Pyrinomonadaceae bacterium]
MKEKIIYFVILIALSSVCVFAQQTPSPQMSSTPASLEIILNEAGKQSLNYREAFKNLLAVETKTFEKYDKNGDLKNKTVVVSNFFVYQSSKDEKTSSELRNVVKVDDELVPDSQARADKFLGELQKTTTVEKELEKVQDEGSRYDKTLKITGLTLYEAIALSENLRSVFDFKLLGTENYQGNEVYVVSYQQTKKSPFITINQKESKDAGLKANFDVSLPGSLKKTDIFLRGKLWIDAKTFQLWREERELAVQTATPIVALETVFEFTPSDFEILVPKQISLLENVIKKSKDKQFEAIKDTKVTFDYSKFRKSETDVQILDDK